MSKTMISKLDMLREEIEDTDIKMKVIRKHRNETMQEYLDEYYKYNPSWKWAQTDIQDV